MSTVAKPLPFGFVPPPFPRPDVELIDEDGIPAENEWHLFAFGALIDSIRQHFRGRQDFCCGGNQFIYFSEQQARNRNFLGPDFYFVWRQARRQTGTTRGRTREEDAERESRRAAVAEAELAALKAQLEARDKPQS